VVIESVIPDLRRHAAHPTAAHARVINPLSLAETSSQRAATVADPFSRYLTGPMIEA
jgi:hypothetical protein